MAAQHQDIIKPRLRVFDLTMIVVGLVIGMGIFRVPAEVAQRAGTPFVFFLAWITGAVVSLIGALTFAEIGSRYPVAGGFYKIFSYCYHPAFAFMVNWVVVISNAAATAAAALMGAEYVAPVLLPNMDHSLAVQWITMVSTFILYIVNMVGIRASARLLNGLMLIKMSMLALLIVSVFFIGGGHAVPLAPQGTPAESNLWRAFFTCLIPIFFTYGGYQQTMNFGNDIPNANKTMPRAIFFGISIILFLYLAVNFAYVSVLGFSGLQHSTTIASDILGILLGPKAYSIVSVIMFCCVMAYVNVSIMSNPRIYFAMAEDNVLPAIFKRINNKTQVQEFSLSVFCIFILVTLFCLSSFQKILDLVMFFDGISIIAAAAAIFVLRYRDKRDGKQQHIFKFKGYPVLPVVFIAAYLAVIISVFYANLTAAIWCLVLFTLGFPLYFGVKLMINRNK